MEISLANISKDRILMKGSYEKAIDFVYTSIKKIIDITRDQAKDLLIDRIDLKTLVIKDAKSVTLIEDIGNVLITLDDDLILTVINKQHVGRDKKAV